MDGLILMVVALVMWAFGWVCGWEAASKKYCDGR